MRELVARTARFIGAWVPDATAAATPMIVPLAGIARVECRRRYGCAMVFAIPWFVLGVLLFTMMPA